MKKITGSDWLPWLLAVSVAAFALLLPIAYFLINQRAERNLASSQASLAAVIVDRQLSLSAKSSASATGVQLRESLNAMQQADSSLQQLRLLSREGDAVIEVGAPPQAPDFALAAPLAPSSFALDRVEVRRSLRPLLTQTLLVGLLSTLGAVGSYLGLSWARQRSRGRKIWDRGRAEDAFASFGGAVIMADAKERITYMNSVAEQLTARSLSEVRGEPLAEVLRLSEMKTGAPVRDFVQRAQRDKVSKIRERVMHTPDDGKMTIEQASALARDHRGKVVGVTITFRDISARKEAQAKLSRLANYDSLTGLPNRTLFRDRLEQSLAIARRERQMVAVLFLDLDRFKTINDSLGHDIGDLLLQQVARRLVGVLRRSDTVARATAAQEDYTQPTVARLGGDEFTIILNRVNGADGASTAARKIVDILSTPMKLQTHEVYASPSIGISLYPAHGENATVLIQAADAAMYRAKELGRNNYQVFDQAMNEQAQAQLSMEASLRRALDRSEFRLEYQPKLDLLSHSIIGVEALLRWHSAELGVVSPAQFIPVLEATGLVVEVGEWAVRAACLQLRRWINAGLPPLTMAVNLSPRQFRHKELAQSIGQILRETQTDPRFLQLEITEGLLVEQSEGNSLTLFELGSMGLQIVVDDFGTGYSSMSYLKRFNLNAIKIDQSFVRGLAVGSDDAAIVDAIIGMGHNLGLKVVAEGVETEGQLHYLRERKCDHIQGYFVSRPLPPADFEKWLRKRMSPGVTLPT